MWQQRWLTHPNGTKGLNGAIICVVDPQATAERYSRFTGLSSSGTGAVWRIDTLRGVLHFIDPEVLRKAFDSEAPSLPFIAGVILASGNLDRTTAALRNGNAEIRTHLRQRIVARLPAALGGFFVYEEGRAETLFV